MPRSIKVRLTYTKGNSIWHFTVLISKNLRIPEGFHLYDSCRIKDFSWCHLSFCSPASFSAKDRTVVFVLLQDKMCCSTRQQHPGWKALSETNVGDFFQSLYLPGRPARSKATGHQINSMHFRVVCRFSLPCLSKPWPLCGVTRTSISAVDLLSVCLFPVN